MGQNSASRGERKLWMYQEECSVDCEIGPRGLRGLLVRGQQLQGWDFSG